MKINSVNGKTVVTLDEDEALIQYDGKTEIQKQQLSNDNTKDETNHVFALFSRSDGGYLDINGRSYSKYNIIESGEAYENIRNERQHLHMNTFSVPFYFNSDVQALQIANKMMIINYPMKIEVVEIEQETGLIIKFH